MSNLVILKWHLEHKPKFEKNGFFSLGPKLVFLTFVFKRLCKESFEDLEFKSNLKFQTRATTSHKMAALKSFCEITQKSSFNSHSLRSVTISGN